MGEKIIVTAAVTGSRPTKDMNPAVPYSPKEIIEAAVECHKAGAAIIHVHRPVRDGRLDCHGAAAFLLLHRTRTGNYRTGTDRLLPFLFLRFFKESLHPARVCHTCYLLFLFSGMYLGAAMGLFGFLGLVYIRGLNHALGELMTVPYTIFSNYDLSVIPLFILMGQLCFYAGMSADLF
jgi:hypothetical protein